ncbi:hypothetical protein IQ06DRAFT_299859 [Phaeosphaeriaceae sp. SRC1lsM3a]|nr:hypothetical protein IQ06DRAFT_299859 [Stagonospora sp. SRC1lsM3a]
MKPPSNRHAVLRTPSFGDDQMTYRLPPAGRVPNELYPSDLICKETQLSTNRTVDSPSLSARAGDKLLLLYQENGHVTKIDQDPGHANSGTIRVFGTSNGSPADSLQRITSTSGPMNDLALLGESNFDDGYCYQDNGSLKANERKEMPRNRPQLDVEGPDIWCSIEITLPKLHPEAVVYTLYWIWDFDGIGFVERYTTCIDINIF